MDRFDLKMQNNEGGGKGEGKRGRRGGRGEENEEEDQSGFFLQSWEQSIILTVEMQGIHGFKMHFREREKMTYW